MKGDGGRFPRAIGGWLSLVFAALFSLAAAAASAEDSVKSFTGVTVDDEKFDLAPYLGKVPILLDFGSIYCSSCVKSIPDLVVLQEKFGKDKFKVVGVNLDTYGIARVKRFFATFKQSLNFPILIDSSLAVSKQFNILSLPTYVLIDKQGKIAGRFEGFDSEIKGRMERAVEKLVKGEKITSEEGEVKQDVAVLAPENFTMTQQDKIFVIGKAGGNPGPFYVRRNGGAEVEAPVKKGMFLVRIPLSLGSNFLEVRYPKGASMGTLAVVLFREPRMGEGTGVKFPPYIFHIPEREGRCAECHKMTPEELEGGPMSGTQFCSSCHAYQTDQKFVHGPIPVGGCPACHDFKSSPQRYVLTGEGVDLCFTCHGDIQTQFQKEYVHGPVAMGLCVVCHSPHGSSFRFQLRDTQPSLCPSCHEDVRPKISRFVQHKPIVEGRCTGCHDPHSSDNPKNFLKGGEGAKLCVLCHPMDRHSHPKEGDTPEFTVKGMELDAKGNFLCKSCHDPHSSDEQKLFTVSGGCNGCHDPAKQIRKETAEGAAPAPGTPAAEEAAPAPAPAPAVEEAPPAEEQPAEEEQPAPSRRRRRSR